MSRRPESPPRSRRPRSRSPRRRRDSPEPSLVSEESRYGMKADGTAAEAENVLPKEKPDFGLSGALTKDLPSAQRNGITVKWVEPGDACKPKMHWKLYPFKGDQELEVIPIHRQSCYFFGRDRTVVDVPVDHPTCSKQHAVLQFRLVEDGPPHPVTGATAKAIKPFLVDLGSTNGTFLKNKKLGKKERLDDSRYYELKPHDVFSFGESTRDYVLLYDELVGKKSNSP